ncbi:putative stress response rci peptide protein [Lasiodiplodia theobromae]|uniref:Plasma membrane proteolipid 3 n=2 Tax=Lasiodiplodia theobromae TaxID=45133 RepID=A0A5N5DT01_9PEZI|nr:Plasma membrane proteolipid 3 [Lasiodiplodia theobromae]KAF9635257.1 putative stress response rci peptide protein [Lasiodiplodia theobromae]
MCGTDIFLAILAILFPPVAVWVKRGVCSADSLINIALCCLGLLPGLVHAWYIIWSHPDRDEYERVADSENGNVTYYYVAHTDGSGPRRPPRGNNNTRQEQYRSHPAGPSYGAVPNQQFHGQQTGLENPWAEEGRSATKQGSSAPPPPPSRGPQPGDSGEGSASQPPPTYAEAVRGDHKVQTQD